jgi:hypothetical protein
MATINDVVLSELKINCCRVFLGKECLFTPTNCGHESSSEGQERHSDYLTRNFRFERGVKQRNYIPFKKFRKEKEGCNSERRFSGQIFVEVTGTINNVLKLNQVQKSSRMKIYNTLAIPALIYGSKIWTLIQQDKSLLKASEMKFLRRTTENNLLDHKKNEDLLQELNTTPVLEKITKYRHNWVKHVHRMNNSGFPKALIEYHPRGRRPGRPLKRLLDGV